MGWLSWLDPPSDFDKNIAKRSRSGNAEQAPWGDIICALCGRSLTKWGMGHCRCDPE